MIVGIVGPEAAKFTPALEERARVRIRGLLFHHLYSGGIVCSGACPRGGIDIWAVEEARGMGIGAIEFPPVVEAWERGYKPRNIQIAKASDIVICVTVPSKKTCRHCGMVNHVQSGGCWTLKYAKKIGKPTELVIL